MNISYPHNRPAAQTDEYIRSVSVAPMMAWTDRHCRYLHRLYSPSVVLFTEMVTTAALLTGHQWQQLDYNPEEHPLVLQLGGNDPADLAECAKQAEKLGYDEVNLNVGCPSDRVQKGTFGACLMRQPNLVAECIKAMQEVCEIPITVKCRLGVDNQDSDENLDHFIDQLAQAGCQRIYLHARKAILGGLTPAQNRSIPPLQPQRVLRAKQLFPQIQFVINGGITETDQCNAFLDELDGVMIGRAAYQNPALLTQIHYELHPHLREISPTLDRFAVLQNYRTYMEAQLQAGVRLHSLTRHVLHSCNGMPGARRFRQILSDNKRLADNDIRIFDEACAQIFQRAA